VRFADYWVCGVGLFVRARQMGADERAPDVSSIVAVVQRNDRPVDLGLRFVDGERLCNTSGLALVDPNYVEILRSLGILTTSRQFS
jgi:hypothetical protein